jgi:hypothetical protein
MLPQRGSYPHPHRNSEPESANANAERGMIFDLGPFAVFICSAYAVSAVGLLGATLWTWAAWRKANFVAEITHFFWRIVHKTRKSRP